MDEREKEVRRIMGSCAYMNVGTTIVDDSPVRIGNRVMSGPHVTLAMAGHPVTRATGQ